MSNDPLAAIRTLRERISEKVDEIGLQLVQFTLPDVPTNEEAFFYGVFVIADKAKYESHVDDVIDQHNFDEMFASMVDDLQHETAEDRERETRDRMAQRLKDLQSRRGDDSTPEMG